jgi:DNA repair exonuclease SbcCD ATPase subunit
MASVRARIAIVLGFSLALAGESAVLIRQSMRTAAAERLIREQARSIEQLREALRQSRTGAAPVAAPPAAAPARGRTEPPKDDRAALAGRDTAIEQLTRELTDARAQTAEAREQLAGALREREQAVNDTNERYQTAQEQWQSRLNGLQNELDAARAKAQAARQRVAELDAVNAKLKAENSDRSARAAEIARTTSGLQDLNRRREAYLTSLIRRYREVSSQLRAMSGMMEASHGGGSDGLAGSALARIQNTLSLAEDDLRQLDELNVRYQETEKRPAKK